MGTTWHRVNLGMTSCYLLGLAEGYLLIDTGYAGDYERFLAALGRLGLHASAIRHLLLTHHHDDHAGFAARLVEDCGCTVIAHRDAVLPLSRGESRDTMKPVNRCVAALFGLFALVHRGFTYPPLPLRDTDIVVDGDDAGLLGRLGLDGELLHTPGHSSDSISVLLADGEAFVGDAAMNFLNLCMTRHRPIFVEDMDAVFRSWRKLAARGAKRIHPAHGRSFPITELTGHGGEATGYGVPGGQRDS